LYKDDQTIERKAQKDKIARAEEAKRLNRDYIVRGKKVS
jgi:hypothetical protein